MPCNHCAEYTRSHLVRQAVAEAGRGLPSIEPGMPVPAGTGLSRRSFLLRSSAAVLSVYGASKLRLGELEAGVAQAAGGSDRVLVSIFLDGGIDSLSVLAPTTDPIYRSLRPSLALAPGAGTEFTEDSRLRWNPAAASFDALHRSGKMSVLPAVGYAEPRPVALHLAPLLGGRATWRRTSRPAGSAGCSTRSAPRTTRFRGSPSTARSRRRWPAARFRWRRSTVPPTTSGRRASGTSPSR